ncbi:MULTISPECIES: hypothetical protein [unclassified Mycobacterium]|uniref:hypothetical protein n=1 Tax=unclassified Mycobacterium TaxID=2642494 RepID=UPI0027417630|nr:MULTISPECIES: hypothetical protein [unclassified Mycobacterium]MDP7703200.1 hypothetical protein [Mycobacterium sp. TY815]MDP7721805.1 hypothetical protein [Mycobacterium sp. TY814]
MTESRHRCLAGRACRSQAVEEVEGKNVELPAITEKPDTLCDSCRRNVHTVITESLTVWDSLHNALGDRAMRGSSERISGTKTPPIPIDVEVDAAKDALAEWLIAAAARVSEYLNTDTPQPKSRIDREQRRIVQACTRLVEPNIDRLLQAPAETVTVWRKTGESTTYVDKTGIDIALEIVRCHRVAHAILGDQNTHQSVQLACPNCHTRRCSRTVTHRKNGGVDDFVACAECKSSWTFEIYQFRCRRDAEDMEATHMDAEKLKQFETTIEDERTKRTWAEWLLAEMTWKFTLALDCPNVSAADFANAVLEHTKTSV